jgi:hypothetical protein
MTRKRKTIRHSTYLELRRAFKRKGYSIPTGKTAKRNGVLKPTRVWGLWEIAS